MMNYKLAKKHPTENGDEKYEVKIYLQIESLELNRFHQRLQHFSWTCGKHVDSFVSVNDASILFNESFDKNYEEVIQK